MPFSVPASNVSNAPALALEQVVVGVAGRRRAVRLAELLGEDVADVVAGRGQAPRVVLRAPDQDVHRQAGHRRALGLDARARADRSAGRSPGSSSRAAGPSPRARCSVAERCRRDDQEVRGLLARRCRGRGADDAGSVARARRRRGSSDSIEPASIDDRARDLAAGERPVVEAALRSWSAPRGRRRASRRPRPRGPAVARARAAASASRSALAASRAAAGTEDRADERGHRDHVVDGRRRLVDAVRRPCRR